MKIRIFIATIFKVTAFILALSVLLPSAVKMAHIFTHHSHDVCNNDNKEGTHFHQSDLDCDFYKFKINHNQYFVHQNLDDVSQNTKHPELLSHKYLIESRNLLTKFLRGPPHFS